MGYCRDFILTNGKTYRVTSERGRMKVEEMREFFDGKILSTTGNITYLDNMPEVREFLRDENGGIPI